MLIAILAWIAKSQGAKTAGAAAGGSIASVAILMGLLDQKIDTRMIEGRKEIIQYVDNKHLLVLTKFNFMGDDISEIKELVKITNQRVYELNLKTKGN